MTAGRRVQARVVRAIRPYWSHDPLSGEGAALRGGRFNPVGTPALYASFRFETAAREVRFGTEPDPFTFVWLEGDCSPIADLAESEERRRLRVDLAALACPDWEDAMTRGREPASHALANRLIADGYCGMTAPSFASGSDAEDINLVLWRWADALPCRVTVLERDQLPHDQRSWH